MVACWTLGSTHLPAANPTNRLLGLPIELLTEIIKILPWKDVLRVQETCKLLSEASKAKAVWARFVQEHISSKEVPPRLERPIELYTSHELESLVLRWKSAEIGWKRDDGQPARERSFQCEAPEFTHLVNGGRWFLVTQKSGEVTYYDLEEETISAVQLIPPQFVPDYLLVALDIDTDSPVIKFNMAFSTMFATQSNSAENVFHGIHIWSINAVFNDHGCIVGLCAFRLARFRHRPILSTILDLALRGFQVAFTCSNHQIHRWHIIVLGWNQVDEDSYYRPRIIATDRANHSSSRIFLLPGTRLLLIEGGSFRLHDYSNIKETTDFLDHNGQHALLWTQRFPVLVMRHNISVFSRGNTTYVFVSGVQYLYRFSINNILNTPPLVSNILSYPKERYDHVFAFGFYRGIFYDENQGNTMLVGYSPPGRPRSSSFFLFKKISSNFSQKFDIIALDEATGRVVLNCRGANIGHVMDYALIATV